MWFSVCLLVCVNALCSIFMFYFYAGYCICCVFYVLCFLCIFLFFSLFYVLTTGHVAWNKSIVSHRVYFTVVVLYHRRRNRGAWAPWLFCLRGPICPWPPHRAREQYGFYKPVLFTWPLFREFRDLDNLAKITGR